MDNKFKAGLANSAIKEFENIRLMREEYIACGAESEFIITLEASMNAFLNIYMTLTKMER